MKKSQRSDAGDGNVTTIDLGEKIDEVIRGGSVGLAGRGRSSGKAPQSRMSRFSGGYRPGMYGGYRPWYASRLQGQGDWKLGSLMRLPEGVREKSKELFTGGLIGTVGNRVIAWVAPGILKTDSALAVNGVAFGVTLLPYIFKQNVTTFGIALPGFFYFLGTLAEEAIGMTKLLGEKPSLKGPAIGQQQRKPSHADAVMAARRKLAEAQARMQGARPAARPQQPTAPRVVARPTRVA